MRSDGGGEVAAPASSACDGSTAGSTATGTPTTVGTTSIGVVTSAHPFIHTAPESAGPAEGSVGNATSCGFQLGLSTVTVTTPPAPGAAKRKSPVSELARPVERSDATSGSDG